MSIQNLVTLDEMELKVVSMVKDADQHPAVRNAFYDLWMSQRLNAAQVEIFAKNYYERTRRSAFYIALAFLQMAEDDTEGRVQAAENLMDEMGNGDPQRAHSLVLAKFLELLMSRVRGERVTMESVQAPILPSTVRVVEEGEALFKSSSRLESYGALLAKEWHAYTQLIYIYEGVRNYMDLFDFEEFHDSCEYFYGHIGSVEKEHRANSQRAAARICRSSEDFAELRKGYHAYLDMLADNWLEMHKAILAA